MTVLRTQPLILIARGDSINSWPAVEREEWQMFWTEVDAAADR